MKMSDRIIPEKFLRPDFKTFKRKYHLYCYPTEFKIIRYEKDHQNLPERNYRP